MSPIANEVVRRPVLPQRLLVLLEWLRRTNRPSADGMSGIDHLTDRQLQDIGVTRPGLARQVNRDLEELRRRGVGPLV